MKLQKVISGGQTGVDQAGLRAARAAGIPTGGWAPKGWATEAGPAPWLAEFGLAEPASANYPSRTRRNVGESDGTLTFEAVDSAGTALTYRECDRRGKPFRCVLLDLLPGRRVRCSVAAHSPAGIAEWVVENKIGVLNVAGNRESKAPGIAAYAERYLAEVFRILAAPETRP